MKHLTRNRSNSDDKTLTLGKLTDAQLLDELRRDYLPKVETVPEGYRTVQQWAEKWGIARGHASRLIECGVRNGKMRRKFFRIVVGQGKMYSTAHFEQVGR